MSRTKPTSEESSKIAKMVGEEIRAGRNPEDTLYVLSTGNFKVIRIDGSSEDDYSRRWEIVKVSSFPSKPSRKKIIVYDEFEEVVNPYPVKPVRLNPPNRFQFPDEIDFSLTDIENSPLSIALERTKPLSKRNNDRDFLGAIIFPPNIQEQ
jgi:hypothetical protein